jgi:hypothetical protein
VCRGGRCGRSGDRGSGIGECSNWRPSDSQRVREDIHTVIQTVRQSDSQTVRQTSKQSDSRPYRQLYIHTDIPKSLTFRQWCFHSSAPHNIQHTDNQYTPIHSYTHTLIHSYTHTPILTFRQWCFHSSTPNASLQVPQCVTSSSLSHSPSILKPSISWIFDSPRSH